MENKIKIKIEKELKIKMLHALKNGFYYKEDFENEFMPSQIQIFQLPDNKRG